MSEFQSNNNAEHLFLRREMEKKPHPIILNFLYPPLINV